MARIRTHGVATAVLVGAAIVSGAVFMLLRTALIDDAYIMLSYARTLAFHGQWGLVPEEFANSATSPLNVLVLGGFTAVLRSPVLALGAVFVLCNALLADALRRAAVASGFPWWSGVVGMLLVLGNPLLLSAVGLEMALASVLLAFLLLTAVRRRPVWFGVVSGLLVLARLDLIVFVLVVFLGRPSLWRGWWKAVLPAVATALPWFAFSWLVFGSAVPDTLVIKQLQESWGQWDFGNGLWLYYEAYPTAVALSVAAAAAALVVAAAWLVARLVRPFKPLGLDTWALLGLGGLLHYYVYTQLEVPPYHWYYAPSLIGLTFLLAAGLGAAVSAARRMRDGRMRDGRMRDERLRDGRLRDGRLRGVVTVAVGSFAVGGFALVAGQGVFAVAHGTPWREAPIVTNWAAPADYARVGEQLGRIVGGGTVSSPGEIGTLAYFCECTIVDAFSDRGYLADLIAERMRRADPFVRWLLELNYTHFEPTQPRTIDFRLHRAPGPGPDPDWTIDSAWTEPTHLLVTEVRD